MANASVVHYRRRREDIIKEEDRSIYNNKLIQIIIRTNYYNIFFKLLNINNTHNNINNGEIFIFLPILKYLTVMYTKCIVLIRTIKIDHHNSMSQSPFYLYLLLHIYILIPCVMASRNSA